MKILIGLLFTICFYMIAPFIYFFRRKNKYTSSYKKKFNIINSIIAFILDTIFIFLLTEDGFFVSIYPPFVYYFINNAIWQTKEKNRKNKNIDFNKRKVLFSIFIGSIIILLSGISLYENIQNEKLKKEILNNNDLLLQECYSLSKERYEKIFETFKKCQNNSCSYSTFEERTTIDLLESEDNSKCRKWFSN